MSAHYDPIPSESDHEDDDTPMVEDDARTERTRSTDRSDFFHAHNISSDSEPEEDFSSPDERAPLTTPETNRRPFGQFRRTARIRATMPDSRERNQPSPSTPPPNPNARASSGMHVWERTLSTLKRWKDSYQQTPAPQMESSSAIRQEFLLDTTPIVVDKLRQHDEKFEKIEEFVMDLPGPELLTEFRYEIDATDSNVAYVDNEVSKLKEKVNELTQQIKNMDHSVYQMENKMMDCHTMTAMAIGTTKDNLRAFFGDQAGSGGK